MAGFLAGVTLPMRIVEPDALRDEMLRLIERAKASISVPKA
jgi:hypothetical protein